ncbi:MAG: AAA family ATPase, partial [Myxococcota bacterium]|nr:AAA family ATPase [Myxococcota bacterium]
MLIHSFEVTNYKGFRDAQRVELASLTLFYGENSSGKSALLRLLPWIAESMADSRPGPCLDGVVGREALWSDLAHVATLPIEVKLRWQAGPTASWALRGGPLPGTCELKTITLEGGPTALSLADDGDGTWRGRVSSVSGMLPSLQCEDFWSELGLRRRSFGLEVQWLQGIRAGVPRVEKALAAPPAVLSATGKGVARFLYHWDRVARSKRETQALGFVLRFFERLGLALRASDIAPGFFRLEVGPLNGTVAISLVDTGEGLTQVLAPLVALARAAYGLGPGVVCMEQPELHLHTDAQRVLAISIAEAAATGAQVLIETHSEVLLAATQLAVAQQRLQAEQVALYWVERHPGLISVAHQVPLDKLGRVGGGWPIDAFNDLLTLKSELLEAQRGG